MKRICLIHIITKLELGGAQKMVLALLKGIDRKRFDVCLITGSEGLLVDEVRRVDGVKVVFVPELVRPIHFVKDLLALLHIYRIVKAIKRELTSSVPLIVHTHSSKAGILGRWAALFAGVPLILHTYHGFGFHDQQNFLLRNVFMWVERWTAHFTNKIIGVSEANIQKGLALKVFNREQTLLVRYGIEIGRFRGRKKTSTKEREAFGLPSKGPLVGMVACFKPQKAPMDFIKVAHLIRDDVTTASFVMVGDGELRSDVERLIRDLDLRSRIFLLGWRHDIPEILRILDIFVLTSLWEGLPIVFLEAMAAGLPVVATRVDGAPEVIQDGVNGYLVAPHDVEAMSRRIIELLKDPERARRMACIGERAVSSYNIETMVQAHQNQYETLVRDQ